MGVQFQWNLTIWRVGVSRVSFLAQRALAPNDAARNAQWYMDSIWRARPFPSILRPALPAWAAVRLLGLSLAGTRPHPVLPSLGKGWPGL